MLLDVLEELFETYFPLAAHFVSSPSSIVDASAEPPANGRRSLHGIFLQILLVYAIAAFAALLARVSTVNFEDSWQSTLALQGTMAAAAVLSIKLDKMGWAEAGVRLPKIHRLGIANVFGVVAINLGISMALLAGRFPPMHRVTPHSLATDLFWIAVLCPVAEEFFIRGWFQTALYRTLGIGSRTLVILLSAATFAFLHFFWLLRGSPLSTTTMLVCATFLSGLFFARSRDRSGSVVPAMLLHAIYNLTAVLFAAGIGWMVAHP